MPQTETPLYEIAFVGSGISCSAVLAKLLDKLALPAQQSDNNYLVRIAVIEKEANVWTGVPYGDRSSVNSLTITNLGEFLPISEQDEFLNWLKKNQASWMESFQQKGGAVATEWIGRNLPLIREGRWEELYMPRYLFGEYLKEKIMGLVTKLQQIGRANVQVISGTALDIRQTKMKAFEITIEDKAGKESKILTDKVVLCIGSPPMKMLGEAGSMHDSTYIHDTYSPSLEKNISKIKSVLQSVSDRNKRNLLLLGSNASSLELLYLLNGDEELKALINKIIVLSTSGALPRRITPGLSLAYHFEHMEALKKQQHFDAADLMLAAQKDIERASGQAVNIADAHDALSELVIELIGLLDDEEKAKFHCYAGAEFSKLIRRAGAEYRDAASALEAAGKMIINKGIFTNLVKKDDLQDAYLLRYKDASDETIKQQPDIFSVVVNCGGFEQLSTSSSSPLIANLIRNGLCEINCTKRGLKVSESFEASDRLYVMGPLLGGLFNSKGQLWHVENAKSIFYLSGLLVNEMMEHSFADVANN